MSDSRRYPYIFDLIQPTIRPPDDLHRYYKAASWIQSIVIGTAPPSTVKNEVYLAYDLAYRLSHHFDCPRGEPILFYSGQVCARLEEDPAEPERLTLLHAFSADHPVTSITIFDIPLDAGDVSGRRFWAHFAHMADRCSWTELPLTILDLLPGQLPPLDLGSYGFSSFTICVGQKDPWDSRSDGLDEAGSSIAMELGAFIARRLVESDPFLAQSTVHIEGWLGCRCGRNADRYPKSTVEDPLQDLMLQVLTDMAIQGHFSVLSQNNNSDKMYLTSIALDRAAKEGRLQIRRALCDNCALTE